MAEMSRNKYRVDLETRKITAILNASITDALPANSKPDHLSEHLLRKLRMLATRVRNVDQVKAALTAAIDARQRDTSVGDFQARSVVTVADVDFALEATELIDLTDDAPATTEKRKQGRDEPPAPPAHKRSKAEEKPVTDSEYEEENAPEWAAEPGIKRTRPMRRGGDEAEEPDEMIKKKRGVYSKEQLLQSSDYDHIVLPIDVVSGPVFLLVITQTNTTPAATPER